jgi:hypothetical protein
VRTDQELITNALRRAAEILVKYLEPGPRDAEKTIVELMAILDSRELAEAMKRLEAKNE